MSKHTPGPWSASGIYIHAPNGDRIAYMASRDSQALEDARLIAAAPDMLEALEKIISSWERERLHSNQGNNHAQDEAELKKHYQTALAKLMICEKIKAAK